MTETQPANVTEVKKPHSIADYGVHFRKGFDSRRHVGSPSLGRKITSYWNLLGEEDADGNAAYSEADLKVIIKNPKAPHAKVIAAQDLLRARADGYDKIGRIPKAADSINRIMDRTEGKAKVVVQIEHKDRSLDDIRAEMLNVFAQNPSLLDHPAIAASVLVEARRSADFRDGILPILSEHRPKLLEAIDAVVIEPPEIEIDDSEADQSQ